MDSVVLNIKDFLRVASPQLPKGKVVIPLYQRPYSWKDSRIVELLHDMFENKKFLGILILDECPSHYELIDGQQRITTCMLLLAALHNKLSDLPMTQQIIRNVLFSNNILRIKNDSVSGEDQGVNDNALQPVEKDFLAIVNNRIVLNIQDENDIYLQRNCFLHALEIIEIELDKYLPHASPELYKQILDCSVLVIIKNETDTISQSAEQIFLDINEKAQQLTPADIFKGHCFKNYDSTMYGQLKRQWSRLLKCNIGLQDVLANDLSTFIYHFLIGIWDNEEALDVNEKLTINDRHVLSGKGLDYSYALLESIIGFGESILSFKSNIKTEGYAFGDLCSDSDSHQHEIQKLAVMKMLSSEILESEGSAKYQKFPFCACVYYLMRNTSALAGNLSFGDLRVLLSDFFIYAKLFIFSKDKKSKSSIDLTIRHVLNENPFSKESLLIAAKELRRKQQDSEFMMADCGNNFDRQAFIFSIIDFYNSQTRILENKYQRHDSENHNQEHFVAHKNNRVVWKLSDIPQVNKYGDAIVDLQTGEQKKKKREITLKIPKDLAKRYKQQTVNYIILPEDLNGKLESFDIVYKIQKIEEWFEAPGRSIPNHIQILLNAIKALPSYQELLELKQSQEHDVRDTRNDEVKNLVQEKYDSFLSEYFSEENKVRIESSLQEAYNSCLPIRQQATV